MIEHFAYGWWTPALTVAVSFSGCLMGLLVTTRARRAGGRGRAMWLVLGAFVLGAAGIWAPHLVALVGFSVEGVPIRYGVPAAVLSGVLAVVVSGVGLAAATARPRWGGLLLGATLVASAVMGSHYLALAAVRMYAQMGHAPALVVAATLVALAGCPAALGLAVRVRGRGVHAAAALVLAGTTTLAHYLAMGAVRVVAVRATPRTPDGATALDFALPMIIGLTLLLVVALVLMLSPTRDEPGDQPAARQRLPRAGRTGPLMVQRPERDTRVSRGRHRSPE